MTVCQYVNILGFFNFWRRKILTKSMHFTFRNNFTVKNFENLYLFFLIFNAEIKKMFRPFQPPFFQGLNREKVD